MDEAAPIPSASFILNRRRDVPAFGFALSSEENSPSALVRQARLAEEAGFQFASLSDHFHPWLSAQGNSPFVWAVLGGIAGVTDRLVVGTGVTCPILRIHPAIVAHAAATAAVMLEGRFFLGLGTGEALNELVTGERWPSAKERMTRLREAIAIIRALMSGDTVNHDGEFYTVSEARLFTAPVVPPPILVASASPASARLAAANDGIIATGPDEAMMGAFRDAGGESKPRIGQITVCWDESEVSARKVAREQWATTVLGWGARSAIASPAVFDDVTRSVDEASVAEKILCGPDPEPIVEQVTAYLAAGFDHVYFHQVGPRQEAFLEFSRDVLLPEIRRRTGDPGEHLFAGAAASTAQGGEAT